ncbi:PEP-CTERM system TPR-repeat protein PrsT [Vibrio sp.]|nr:PEP-CTERM system TPR-repeat protein PrsT [Vibrio sp.]
MTLKISKVGKTFSIASLATTSLFFSFSSYADNKYVESAESYLSNNEISSAIIELKNAIQSAPDDATPRLILGEIYLQRGNASSAEKELANALKYGANKTKAVPLLARALAFQNKNQQLIELADEIPLNDPQAKAEMLGLRALAEVSLGNVDTAKKLLGNAADNSSSAYMLVAEARIKAEEQHLDDALKLINSAVKLQPKNSDIWVLKGHIEFALKQLDSSTKSYEEAYKLSPDARHYSLFIARSLVFSKHFDKAEPYIKAILKDNPSYPLANELQATILFSEENYTDAKTYAEKALNNGSTDLATTLISAISSYKLKLYEQANRRLKQVIPRLPANHFARRLYVVTLMKLGYINQAIENMDKLDINATENNRFLSQMSVELSKLGRDEEALSLADKAYKSSQNSNNELMLGLVKLADNDESGLKELQSAIAEQPDKKKAEIGIAYYYIKMGKIDSAQEIADKWLKETPDDVDALTLKGQVYQAKKEFSDAEKTLKRAVAQNEKHTQAQISLAQVLISQNKFDEAFAHAIEAKKLAPESKPATQVLFFCANKLNKIGDVANLIDDQLSSNHSNIILKQQKAAVLVLQKKPREAIQYLQSIPDDDKNADVWSLIGDIHYMQKEWLDAQRAYAKWLDLEPTDVRAYIRNININEKSGKLTAGISLAEKAASIFPNDIRFKLMKAELLIKARRLDGAQSTLRNLPEKVKATPYAVRLQGLIYVLNKEYPKAVELQEKTYKQTPSLETARDLASAYELNDQAQKAVSFLNQVIEEYPEKAKALQLLLADIQTRTNPEKAISEYLTIIKREPKNVIALNNLSWIYMNQNQIDKACEYSAKAYNLASDQPAISDTHGYCLLLQGHNEKAKQLLETAYRLTKGNSEIALHYAESLIKSGSKAQAQNILSEVDTLDPKLASLKDKLVGELK